jgi:PAS domain S-box-containing protein
MGDEPGGSLRLRAEALVPGRSEQAPPLDAESAARVLHELTVHQVELELQNEELRRAQVELQAARGRYVDLYDTAPVGYCTLGRDGRLRQLNLVGAELLGAPRGTLAGRSLDDLVAVEDRPRCRELRAAVFAGGAPGTCVLRRAGDGAPRWLELSAALAADPAGAAELRLVLADVTARKLTEEALHENTLQLHQLSQRVLAAQESERRRVACELHDELGQLLTALRTNLALDARPNRTDRAERSAESLQIVDDAIGRVRRLARTLRPALLDELGLEPALQWLGEQTSRPGLSVDVRCHAPDLRLAPEVEAACFRVVQEALTNIVRHAEATAVRVDMARDRDTLVLSVKDDGRGFDPAAARRRALAGGSLGLLSMEERAVLLGGRLEVRSQPGAGTRVLLQVPLGTSSSG